MKYFFLLALGVVALGACKKDSEPAPGSSSRTDLLTAKNWRLSAYTSTYTAGGVSVPTDEFAAMSACERDNFAKFSANKSVVFDEGATKCDPTDPQTETGSWDFNGDQTKLTIPVPQLGGTPLPLDIVDLSATTLHLRYSYTYSTGGVSYSQAEDLTFTAF